MLIVLGERLSSETIFSGGDGDGEMLSVSWYVNLETTAVPMARYASEIVRLFCCFILSVKVYFVWSVGFLQ